ncbi:MAG: Inositol-1-monophosphatase [Alphaproteobacteria bacterium MarineAlpha5_Bin12]|nr:inositol monophosphatase [Pelagibacteraceae bacterium]PPR41120.1 MAG: Inositol-1-monophosphatase [Alphaproteobacteria bacterium MarineAlpha5_Bin12]|tara:strand:+ start:9985 stop:10758 length:774 start_codon:yes stop_codon:yes gene_type:complete
MITNNQPPIINIMEKAARTAGKKLIRDFGELEKLQVSSKTLGNFVTNADVRTEKILKESLEYHYPNYGFIMEEEGNVTGKDKDNTFVIDPIDGTSNFIHGIPHFCIAIAKLSNDTISDGIIFNPITNEFYWASKGKGSWLNNQRLRVSNRKKLEECVIGASSIEKDLNSIDKLNFLKKNSVSFRNMGSAALDLAYVASGKLDAFWGYNLNLWDIAAGIILALEAGGTVTTSNFDKWDISSRDILASNSFIHSKVLKI